MIRNIFFVFLSLLSFGCSSRENTMQFSERIIFFGDSITELGVEPNGYVTIVRDSINTLGYHFDVIGAGMSGNKVGDLQTRLQNDVLSKKPTIVVIYIGINDVWHYEFANRGLTGTPKTEFESGLKNLIQQIQSAGAKIILCTPSVIGEKNDGTNKYDAMLDEYSVISRTTAAQLGIPICDLRKTFLEHLQKGNPSNAEKNRLTFDGVHLNDAGNRFVAEQMLKALDGLGIFLPR